MNKLEGIKEGDTVEVTFRGEVKRAYDDGEAYIILDGAVGGTAFLSCEVASPHFSIKKVEKPLAVGDRVRFASNELSTTGVIVAFDGSLSVVRFEPPSGGSYYDGVRTDALVRA